MTPNGAKLAGQIRLIQQAIGKAFDWDALANTQVVEAVAAYMDANGTTDVRNLGFYRDDAASLDFFYDIATGVAYPNAPGADGSPLTDHLFYQMQIGHVEYWVHVVYTSDGYPVFVALRVDQGPTWPSIVRGLVPIAALAISAAFPALAATLGQYICGAEFAAAYPAIATGIGNACVSTAFNGGDVKAAVISSLSGGIGQGAGGLIASITDSTIIGNVAAATTKALITGGDVAQAAAGSLISSGITSIAALPSVAAQTTVPTGTVMKLGELDDDLSLQAPANNAGSTSDVATDYSDYGEAGGTGGAGTVYQTGGPAGAVLYGSDAPGAVLQPMASNQPPSGPSGVVASSNGVSLTALATTALQLVNSWHNAGNPAIMASSGTTQANPNGTLTVRNANGTVSTVQMPAGTPYLTTTGALVTNNGNGTFTTINPNGQQTVSQYGAIGASLLSGSVTIGGMQIPTVVLAGGAALALFLAMRR